MNIETIKEFIKWAEHIPYVEVIDSVWVINDNEVSWCLQPDLEFDYSSEINSEPVRKDGLVVINTDNGCGETVTLVFLASEELSDENIDSY